MAKKTFSSNMLFNLFVAVAGLVYVLIMGNLLFLQHRFVMDSYNYNIVPFETISRYIVNHESFNTNIIIRNLLGNIILFIPIGIIAPLLCKPLLRFMPLILFAAGLIICVELAQMLLRVGAFDIDDVILNTFGAVIGLCTTRLVLLLMRRRA